MDDSSNERFRANYLWFNKFFSDLKQLLEMISGSLGKTLSLKPNSTPWYYEKSNYQPGIPPYYLTSLRGENCIVQIYAVVDSTIIDAQPAFKNELSLIIVKHSRPEKDGVRDYGLRIFKGDQITQTFLDDKVITGQFLAGVGQGASYYAFQVPLDLFAAGADIDAVIQKEIVEVMSQLPDWEG